MSASKDGTIRLWNVSAGKEIRQWAIEGRRAAETMLVLDNERVLRSLGLEDDDRVMLVGTKEGIAIVPWTSPGWFVANPDGVGQLVSFAYSHELDLVATGHTNGVASLQPLTSLQSGSATTPKLFRRNESPVYSLFFSTSGDLFMGTAAGLPCRLAVESSDGDLKVSVKEELAGWEAFGIECWTEGNGSIWCAGGEGGIRRY